jgi:hypothetical protein
MNKAYFVIFCLIQNSQGLYSSSTWRLTKKEFCTYIIKKRDIFFCNFHTNKAWEHLVKGKKYQHDHMLAEEDQKKLLGLLKKVALSEDATD